MEEKTSKSLQYYMRTLHRVLGYLTLGLVIVYSLSGIVLIHRKGDFMKTNVSIDQMLDPNMSAREVSDALKMKVLNVKEETDTKIVFTDGQYDKQTGKVSLVKQELIFPFYKFASLHKMPCSQNPHIGWFTTIFGISLFLLAVSSLFMFKTKTKQFRTNMIYTAIGITIAVLLVIFI